MKWFSWFCLVVCMVASLQAASYLPVSEAEEVAAARGVFVGKLLGREVVEGKGGSLHTRALFEVEEVVKGTFAPNVVVRHRGGALKERAELAGDAPQFLIGQRYLLCVREGEGDEAILCLGGRSARWLVCEGGELGLEARMCVRRFLRLAGDGLGGGVFPRVAFPEWRHGEEQEETHFVQEYEAVTGLNAFRIPADQPPRPVRFTRADLGEPIPYIVDRDTLPSGLSEAQALTALESALDAWSEVTGIAFQSAGFASFGRSAADVPSDEEVLRIQFHDLYNRITNGATLGVGGAAATNGTFDGGAGGRVFDTEFHRTTSGYVVMDHTKASLSDPVTFEEVLCHEIGHALGLAHSSENEGEVDAQKREAIMYFRTHSDGRGASVRAWDIATIRQSFPEENLPPRGQEGYLDIVTRPNGWGLSQPQVNVLTLRGADRDSPSDTLTLTLASPTSSLNGAFSLSGNQLSFTPLGFFNVAFQYDVDSNGFYDRATLRFDDGVHGSPLFRVRVLSLQADSSPNGTSDGLPNDWVSSHFASDPDPDGDADSDGLSNVAEFLQRTDPQDPESTLRVGFDPNSPVAVPEGTLVVLPLQVRGGTPFRDLVVPLTLGGSATEDEDYTLFAGGTAVIPPGQTEGRVVLRVQTDGEAEPDETITIALGDVLDGLGVKGTPATLTLTITGDIAGGPTLATLGNVRVSGNQLYVSWLGAQGENYALERSADLSDWTKTGDLVGNGAWGEVSIGLDDAPVFLRIRND